MDLIERKWRIKASSTGATDLGGFPVLVVFGSQLKRGEEVSVVPESQLLGAVEALARLFDLELVVSEAVENEHGQAAIREAQAIVNSARGQ